MNTIPSVTTEKSLSLSLKRSLSSGLLWQSKFTTVALMAQSRAWVLYFVNNQPLY